MHIAYVTADRGIPVFGQKGASVHVRAMVNAFSDLNHTVEIFAARRGPQTHPLSAKIIKVVPTQSEVECNRAALDNKTAAKERYSMAVSASIEAEIKSAHGRAPFDFIYERYALFSTSGIRAAAALRIPCAVEVNSPLVVEQGKYRSLENIGRAREVEQEVFTNASKLFCVSDQMRDYAVNHGANPDNSSVVPNAIDPLLFKPVGPRIQLREIENKFVVGFVGSLKSWHGIDVLVEAFRDFAKLHEDVHLLVVGDGPQRDWFEGYLAGSSLAEKVTLTGWLSHDELPAWLRAMNVAVAPYPSIDDFYFSPLKLYEYLACGVPVVASRIGQIDSALCHGENALLVAPGSVAEFYEALNRLYLDKALRNRLGSSGFDSVRGQTWSHNADRVVRTVMRRRSTQSMWQEASIL